MALLDAVLVMTAVMSIVVAVLRMQCAHQHLLLVAPFQLNGAVPNAKVLACHCGGAGQDFLRTAVGLWNVSVHMNRFRSAANVLHTDRHLPTTKCTAITGQPTVTLHTHRSCTARTPGTSASRPLSWRTSTSAGTASMMIANESRMMRTVVNMTITENSTVHSGSTIFAFGCSKAKRLICCRKCSGAEHFNAYIVINHHRRNEHANALDEVANHMYDGRL